MSTHVIGIAALVVIFIVGTLRPVNIGALSLIATFLVGTLVVHEGSSDLLAGFPASLFVLLVGVTYLFGLATVNGTLEWLVDKAIGFVGDRRALVPWIIFAFSAIPSTLGALGPASVAMLAPLAMRLSVRYHVDRRMTALMVMNGSGLGNFSPLNALAAIVRQVSNDNGLRVSASSLFIGNAAISLILGVAVYVTFGGLGLLRQRRRLDETAMAVVSAGPGAAPHPSVGVLPVRDTTVSVQGSASGGAEATTALPPADLRKDQWGTLVAIIGVAVGALVFDIEIGFLALAAAGILHLMFPTKFVGAEKHIVWSVVLLICGVVTFVALLQRNGTVEFVGQAVAGLGTPLLAAFLLCLAAAVTSAFGSSAGLLGVLIPLSIPLLAAGAIEVTGMIVALAIAATVVDATPFSAVGALILSNAPEDERQTVFRAMFGWGMAMVVVAPPVVWLVFIFTAS
ncbi:SLC13 family permease [Mycolicibacterium goodii]|uniref:C4-dicarboxylate ABC transporter n=1 Tax=Mycolicibacterium goodii TaxID=134601 RepID=A0A0K0X8R3_MYCGD|nr:C4-dicarboxylate ABC transporter [Mycolicibacterium goodii]